MSCQKPVERPVLEVRLVHGKVLGGLAHADDVHRSAHRGSAGGPLVQALHDIAHGLPHRFVRAHARRQFVDGPVVAADNVALFDHALTEFLAFLQPGHPGDLRPARPVELGECVKAAAVAMDLGDCGFAARLGFVAGNRRQVDVVVRARRRVVGERLREVAPAFGVVGQHFGLKGAVGWHRRWRPVRDAFGVLAHHCGGATAVLGACCAGFAVLTLAVAADRSRRHVGLAGVGSRGVCDGWHVRRVWWRLCVRGKRNVGRRFRVRGRCEVGRWRSVRDRRVVGQQGSIRGRAGTVIGWCAPVR